MLTSISTAAAAGPGAARARAAAAPGRVINVASESALRGRRVAISSNTTIVLAAGTYTLRARSISTARSPTWASAVRRVIADEVVLAGPG